MNENSPAVTTAQPFTMPATIADITPQQKAWMTMAHNKSVLANDLQGTELRIQQSVKEALALTANDALPTIQATLTEVKASASFEKERRTFFTNTLKTKITDPLMEFEKRNEAEIQKLVAHEFLVRQAVATSEAAGANKKKEEVAFKTHATNENFRRANAYRLALAARITFYYTGAMKQAKMTKAALATYITDIKNELPNIEVEKPVKFPLVLLTPAEAGELFKTVVPYDKTADLAAAVAAVDTVFAMYAEDYKNKEAAAQQAEAALKQTETAANNALEVETATNVLMGEAESVTVLSSGTAIKKSMQVVEENTDEWLMAIMSTFMKNFANLKKYVKVSTASKLSVGQMAAAIGKYATEKQLTFTGIKLEEVKK